MKMGNTIHFFLIMIGLILFCTCKLTNVFTVLISVVYKVEENLLLLFVCLILFVVLCLHCRLILVKKSCDVPGPFAWPLVGHYWQLQRQPFEMARQLAQSYGPVLRLQFGSEAVVVLNDREIIRRAFASRTFSDRPNWMSMKLQNETDGRFAFRPYGCHWRYLRKSTVDALTLLRNRSADCLQAYCQQALRQLFSNLDQLNGRPVDPAELLSRFFLHAVGKIAFGEQGIDVHDPDVEQIFFQSPPQIQQLSRIGNFVDCFPKLCWLYRNTIKLAKQVNQQFDQFVSAKVDQNEKNAHRLSSTHSISSLADALLLLTKQQQQQSDQSQQHPAKYAIIDALGAGLATSTSTALWAVLMLAKFPDVQQKLKQELDLLNLTTDHDHDHEPMLTIEHRPRLVYAEAFLNEVFRFGSVLPFAIPHATVSNATLDWYHIAQGVPVLGNLWAVHHDQALFPDPMTFNPDRFIRPTDGTLNRQLLANVIPFSTGTRRCPGEFLARQNLFLLIINLIKRFQIQQPFPQFHRHNYDVTKFQFNFTRKPMPFQVRFIPWK
ncbi:Cytochrome P450 1A1 [Trichinella zimbabwensis]|uniref:Cytochrome P450 1A1 n=1 Tax=Trichinella zimbabwensis TaxID=268475 RepID=A0A0V1HCL4_9BILA|nr:Cytochrome P450 1A1 [Trichinella zimbabwensis]